jgi:hypothetical protein
MYLVQVSENAKYEYCSCACKYNETVRQSPEESLSRRHLIGLCRPTSAFEVGPGEKPDLNVLDVRKALTE